MMKKTTLLIFALLLGYSVQAQEAKSTIADSRWYVGVRGGMPFGISTFSSFGADKTRLGFSGGVYGGYRFNPILSLEASATFGKLGLSMRDCCIGSNYWLGVDGVRYNAPVIGMNGWDYSNLRSDVTIQQYGVHLNVNVLGFFNTTKESRWSLNLSPAIYAVGTKAIIKAISEGSTAITTPDQWHLGVGGDVMAEYAITKNLTAGLYTGVTYLTGGQLDGMPKYLHKSNYIWESGVRIGWRFGAKKAKSAKSSISPSQTIPTTVIAPVAEPVKEEEEVVAPPVEIVQEVAEPIIEPVKTQEEQPQKEIEPTITFPVIYFSFNSVWIEPEQRDKVKAIADILKQDPQIHITITGYTDQVGSKEANKRVSLQRAEAVKQELKAWLVSGDRITTVGGGIYLDATDNSRARHAATIDIKR